MPETHCSGYINMYGKCKTVHTVYMREPAHKQRVVASARWSAEGMPGYIFSVPWKVKYEPYSKLDGVKVAFEKHNRMQTMRIQPMSIVELRRGDNFIQAKLDRVTIHKNGRTATVSLDIMQSDML